MHLVVRQDELFLGFVFYAGDPACVPVHHSSQVCVIFIDGIVYIVHTIWVASNILLFSSDKISFHATKAKIMS